MFAPKQTIDRNRSENYEFFQAVSHFRQDPSMNNQTIMEAAKKIFNLYVFETAPLKVALGDGICGAITQVCMEHCERRQGDELRGFVLLEVLPAK